MTMLTPKTGGGGGMNQEYAASSPERSSSENMRSAPVDNSTDDLPF
jgi:hypothetical protein